jgi:hypothetical protein
VPNAVVPAPRRAAAACVARAQHGEGGGALATVSTLLSRALFVGVAVALIFYGRGAALLLFVRESADLTGLVLTVVFAAWGALAKAWKADCATRAVAREDDKAAREALQKQISDAREEDKAAREALQKQISDAREEDKAARKADKAARKALQNTLQRGLSDMRRGMRRIDTFAQGVVHAEQLWFALKPTVVLPSPPVPPDESGDGRSAGGWGARTAR